MRLGKIALLAVVLLFLFFFMLTGAGSGQIAAFIALIFGWIGFLQRTLPKVSWNWDLVCMGILCSATILFLAHHSLNWIVKRVNSTRNQTWKWPWKWTVCGLASTALLFLVGMSVGGAAHQIGWITSSKEPWYEQKPAYLRDIISMKELDLEFRQALLDFNTVDDLRGAMWNSDVEKRHRSYQQKSLIQSYHMLFIVESDGKVTGIVMFPRDQERRARIGGYYATENDNHQIPAKDLPETIRSFQGKLIAL